MEKQIGTLKTKNMKKNLKRETKEKIVMNINSTKNEQVIY